VIELGYADPKHIGLNGHSYGGEGAVYRPRVRGCSRRWSAPACPILQRFRQSWAGRIRRWPMPRPDAFGILHLRSGPLGFLAVDKPSLSLRVPLPMPGNDGGRSHHAPAPPTERYRSRGLNFLQRAPVQQKDATLLPTSGRGTRVERAANKKDLTIRYMQFMDHYLKGAPAAKWMTDGCRCWSKRGGVKDPK